MFYIIYKVTNIINQKFYIGAHKTSNLDDGYLGSGIAITSAIKKYGKENFHKEILHIFDTPEEMFDCETEIVTEELRKDPKCYNVGVGGIGDRGVGKLHKDRMENDPYWKEYFSQKLSESHKNGRMNPFTGKEFLGKKHTAESKEKMRLAKKGKCSGENNNQFGKVWIYNELERKSIKIDGHLLSEYEEKGWIKGRKMKF